MASRHEMKNDEWWMKSKHDKKNRQKRIEKPTSCEIWLERKDWDVQLLSLLLMFILALCLQIASISSQEAPMLIRMYVVRCTWTRADTAYLSIANEPASSSENPVN